MAGSLGYFKRRHVHNESEAARRVPLGKCRTTTALMLLRWNTIVIADPLSVSETDNRPRLHRDPSWPESSLHSLGTTPKSRSGDGNHSNGTAYSWPPVIKSGDADNTAGSERPPLIRNSARYSPDARESLAAGSAPAWPPPRSRSDLSSIERRTSRWDVDKVVQYIRSRSSSMPHVRRPPGDLWKAGPSSNDPARTIYGLVNDRDSMFDSPPSPGLAKRRCSESDVTGRGSWSSSLAIGSQPLRADESPKPVPPIGAERSRVASMTQRRSKSVPPAGPPSSDEDDRPYSRLKLKSDGTWRDSRNTHLLGYSSVCGAPEKSTLNSPITKDEFNHLLRQTMHNKHTSKVFSPLSPLRNPPPSLSLTVNPAYQRYFPSSANRLSLRYTKGPGRRVRK